jgi:hypothetical protein
MMKKYLLIILAAVRMTSCIEPIELIPDIEGTITALEVEGQTRTPSINAATRTINIELGEGDDLASVKVTRIELIETATCDIAAGSVLDLTSPLNVTVTTVADYLWTITATKAQAGQRALPGGSFDEWNSVGSTRLTWNPWPEGGIFGDSRWWDTGNSGVTTIRDSNTTPTEQGEGCPTNPSGRAARLETVFAVTKVAGGNIYFGKFGGLSGMNAKVEMGHPWNSKPKGLKGWYKYFPQPVDRTLANYVAIHPYGLSRDQWTGSMDSLHVSMALWASPDGKNVPFIVDTNINSYVDITPGSEGIIAWGSFISGEEQAEWKEFNVEMKYFNDGPLPANTYLIVQATPSKHCNYFIGGTSGGGPDGKTGSLAYVDEFELVY